MADVTRDPTLKKIHRNTRIGEVNISCGTCRGPYARHDGHLKIILLEYKSVALEMYFGLVKL